MVLEPGKAYRAKTAAGHEITFTVIESGDGNWSRVELDEGGVVEPNVWLNTDQLQPLKPRSPGTAGRARHQRRPLHHLAMGPTLRTRAGVSPASAPEANQQELACGRNVRQGQGRNGAIYTAP